MKHKALRVCEMKEIMRVAIIGLGGQGKKYASLIKDQMEGRMAVTAICTRSEENHEWARQNLGGEGREVFLARNEAQLYGRDQKESLFDAVIVTTPHRLHPGSTIRALRAGKQVLCDKPAGITSRQARQMLEASRETGGTYGLIFHQKVQPKYQRIKALLEEGAIGDLLRVSMVNTIYFRTRAYHLSGSWRSSWKGEGGGGLINQGHHFLCLYQWLFGMPKALSAHIRFGKYNEFSVDDEALLVLEHEGGMSGTFFLSTGEAVGEERLEISGTRGTIVLDGQDLTVTRLDQDSREYALTSSFTSDQGLASTVSHESFSQAADPYGELLRDFVEAAREGREPLCPGEDGWNTLALTNAAYLSAFTGQRVGLPLDEEDYERELSMKVQEEERNR